MAYDVVAYAPELAPQIAQLQTHLWSPDAARNAAYLRWKYSHNPYLDEGLIRLAIHDGQVVAMRGLFGALWEVGDAAPPHLLPYADDFVVAPAHRNRGIAHRVMTAVLDAGAERGLLFAVGLSAGPVTFVNSLATGWRAAGSFQSVWRHPSPGRLQRRVYALARRIGLDRERPRPSRLFDRLDRRGRRAAGRISLAREPRPREMAELIRRLPWDGRIRHVRDEAYLAWRLRNPLHVYRFLFRDEGGVQGYLVLSDHPEPGSVNIADWEAVDDRVRAGLLDAALRGGRFRHVHAWTAGASPPIQALLHARGFVGAPTGGVRGGGLLVRRLGEADPGAAWMIGNREALRIANWDLRILYSMTA